jgi:hypothetical protein
MNFVLKRDQDPEFFSIIAQGADNDVWRIKIPHDSSQKIISKNKVGHCEQISAFASVYGGTNKQYTTFLCEDETNTMSFNAYYETNDTQITVSRSKLRDWFNEETENARDIEIRVVGG